MTDRRNFDTLAPEFRVRINGSEIPLRAKADILSVSVLNDVAAASMFTLTLSSWDTAVMKVRWIDEDLFKEGNGVEIEMGYRDRLEKIFNGEITSLEPAFPEGEPSTLTIRGYDRRHRLMGKYKTRTFLKMKDSDIASQIAGNWNLTPDVKDTKVVLDYVLQHNQSDFEFLQERAQRIGYEMVVTETTLHFRPRQNEGRPTVTLNREVELLDFFARLTTIGQVEEVIVQGWDPRNKKEVVARAKTGDERQMGGTATGPATVRQAFEGTGGMTVNMPVLSQDEADQLAARWFGEMALSYVEGHGVCIGRESLHPGILVDIQGIGRRFSGSYYVTSTEHSYRPKTGYRTAFTVRRNAT